MMTSFGLAGSGLYDRRVQIVKTHWPKDDHTYAQFMGQRAILLVRNPLDQICSEFNFKICNHHRYSLSDEDFKKHPEPWTAYTNNRIHSWAQFQQFWLEMTIPKHIIRYEDLIEKPVEVLTDLIKFVLNVDDISGTKVERLINDAAGNYDGVYKPRPGGGGVGKNINKYSEQQKEYIQAACGDLLKKFDYMD